MWKAQIAGINVQLAILEFSYTNNICAVQSPPNVLEQQGQFLFVFAIGYTEDNWVWGQKMYIRWQIRISAFSSWYFYLDLLINLENITVCIRPPNS